MHKQSSLPQTIQQQQKRRWKIEDDEASPSFGRWYIRSWYVPIDGRRLVASLVAAARLMLMVDAQTIIAADDRRIEDGASCSIIFRPMIPPMVVLGGMADWWEENFQGTRAAAARLYGGGNTWLFVRCFAFCVLCVCVLCVVQFWKYRWFLWCI